LAPRLGLGVFHFPGGGGDGGVCYLLYVAPLQGPGLLRGSHLGSGDDAHRLGFGL
jgi:hypothetical protein